MEAPTASLSARLVQLARLWAMILLGMAALAPRWVLVHHQVGRVPVEFSSTRLHLIDIPLFLAVGLWLAVHLIDNSRPLTLRPWSITLPLLLWVLLSGLSLFWAASKPLALEQTIRLGFLFGFYLLIRNECQDQRRVAWVLVVGMGLQALLASLQFWTQSRVEWPLFGELGVTTTEPWLRGYGLVPHSNILGGFLVWGLFALIGLTGITHQSKGKMWLLLGLFALGVSGLLSTFSRSAWLGMGLGLGLLLLMSWQRLGREWWPSLRYIWLVGGLVTVIYLTLWPALFVARLRLPAAGENPMVSAEVASIEQLDLETRAQYQQTALALIGEHFPGGVGSANFSIAAYLHQPEQPPTYHYSPVHNTLLLLTAELGLLGGLNWLLLLAAIMVQLWVKRSQLGQNRWLLVWSAALLALLATSFFDFYLWGWQTGRVMLWGLLGLWAGALDHSGPNV